METRDQENSTLAFLPEENAISVAEKDQLRERIKIEFYKTYDVMTGIRIAATLGGFFSMMILLVLYKNYCKPSKTLSEEQLNAAVTAAAEEEDRALQAALEATSFYTALDKRRQSLGNSNQILLSPRFSSVGGGYSHLTPPLKTSFTQQRGESLPGSVLQFGSNSPSNFQRDDRNHYFHNKRGLDRRPSDFTASKSHLNILPSRRVSSVTCFSADSAYLERRCSAFEMGLPVVSHFLEQSREKLVEKKKVPWDYYYPIDIQVIQPTPEVSPAASEKNLNEKYTVCGLKVPGIHEMHNLSLANFDIGLAPLASISSLGGYSQASSIAGKSLNTSSSNPPENQSASVHDSTGSDSVFLDVDEMATDSEFEYDGFDDDYSFCETKQSKPPCLGNKSDEKTLQFASFDSYDTSVKSELDEEESESTNLPKTHVSLPDKQQSGDLKRHMSLHEGSKVRRKLVKTNSEPKSVKVPKMLPPWTDKGKSGYIPKRQMSSPSKRTGVNSARTSETSVTDATANDKNVAEENKNVAGPPSTNCFSDSVTLVPNVQKSEPLSGNSSRQGPDYDLPLMIQQKTPYKQLSLPTAQERRRRLQKQKNFIEDKQAANESIEEKTEGSTSVEGSEPTDGFSETTKVVAMLPTVDDSKSPKKSVENNAEDIRLSVNS